ncbi:ATP-dependent DNA helicase srs2 [Leucoagaricus gongylophorus]
MSPPDLIRKLLQRIDYQQYLRRTQSDWDSRWQNVEELITFASEIKTVDIQDGDVSMEQYVLP